MREFSIGVMLESFRKNTESALKAAADLGVEGVQIHTTYGELQAEKLSFSDRKLLMDKVRSHGLVVSALCADFGHGFSDPVRNPENIERSKRVMDLALDLNTRVVTTHIGVIPNDPREDKYKIMQEACGDLAAYAHSLGAHFAVETGPETAVVLRGFLDSLGSNGVAVNMDPANFVMVTGDDPVKAVYTLGDYIVHTHAKDGRKLLDVDPLIIYREIEEQISAGEAFVELPLGQGDVDFDAYLGALRDIGYKGFLTIEREVGENPLGDIGIAVEFLRGKIR